jgi:hypothetical protein
MNYFGRSKELVTAQKVNFSYQRFEFEIDKVRKVSVGQFILRRK